MTRSKHITLLAGAGAAALIALVAAACGSSGAAESGPPESASGASATVGARDDGDLGTLLVDALGRTLYLFQQDSGTQSVCFGACADAWPPLRDDGKPIAGGGLSASLLGTTARSDGRSQVTYNGHPLYLFAGDEEPGETEGQGSTAFGSPWYVLNPNGDPITAPASSDSGASAGGYGY